MSIHFKGTIPILRIFSIEKAKEFYVDFLGFKVDWEHRFNEDAPVYMQVSRGDLVLHLSEHHGDSSPGLGSRWYWGLEYRESGIRGKVVGVLGVDACHAITLHRSD